MKSPGPSFRQRLLIESLTVLAADAAAQKAWLEGHGVSADEFALDFEHAVRFADSLVAGGYLHPEVLPQLRDIDRIFSEMSGEGDASRWTAAALAHDGAWEQARLMAREVLVTAVGEWELPMPSITVVR